MGHRDTTVLVNSVPSSEPYKIPYVSELHPHPRKRPGMEFRTSTRWFSQELSVRKVFQIPFISRSGKISVNTLFFWRSYPEQVYMSVVATVYRRILAILLKRFKIVGRRLRDACIKVSAVYVINKDDYIIDRFLGMSRPGTPIKHIGNFAHYCAIQLDDDKRFVYSQALRRADWLKFQAHGPGDKSSKHMCHRTHLRGLLDGLDGQAFLRRFDREKLINFWISERPPKQFRDLAHTRSNSWCSEQSLFQSEPLTVEDFLRDDLWT